LLSAIAYFYALPISEGADVLPNKDESFIAQKILLMTIN